MIELRNTTLIELVFQQHLIEQEVVQLGCDALEDRLKQKSCQRVFQQEEQIL